MKKWDSKVALSALDSLEASVGLNKVKDSGITSMDALSTSREDLATDILFLLSYNCPGLSEVALTELRHPINGSRAKHLRKCVLVPCCPHCKNYDASAGNPRFKNSETTASTFALIAPICDRTRKCARCWRHEALSTRVCTHWWQHHATDSYDDGVEFLLRTSSFL